MLSVVRGLLSLQRVTIGQSIATISLAITVWQDTGGTGESNEEHVHKWAAICRLLANVTTRFSQEIPVPTFGGYLHITCRQQVPPKRR